ncbi:hypothetical protein E4T52_12354 [Aureobasidium sp. EXF-3400]|nr:hypothetical protein E4T51_11348 [Aureobasidium sp. EXF-12344]KAI4772660.1 hypothetical protein E4T52_12354 [Aureobasidium sp. EXF-3400]
MDRYDTARRRQACPGRSALGYWLPLVVTVTIATAGLAAWIWSERQHDNDDDDNDRHDDSEDDTYDHPVDYPEDIPDTREQAPDSGDQGFLSRVTGRTPSPQQFFDNAGQRTRSAVGLSGPGTAGRQEEGGEPAFSDNEHWNEEAETKRTQRSSTHAISKPKRTVVVVLNGEEQEDGSDYNTEHAVSFVKFGHRNMVANIIQSILLHLPDHIDSALTNLFVLIYAPNQTSLPDLSTSTSASTTLSSSYASVSYPASSPKTLFDSLWQKSLSLVDKQSQVMPFSTPTGYIHILRHLSPSLVYLPDIPTLSGQNGEHVQQLKGWVGQTILVVGDDGAGGLIDTETDTEDEASRKGMAGGENHNKWWETSDLVGLGKDVEVVDIGRIAEDWSRRVG